MEFLKTRICRTCKTITTKNGVLHCIYDPVDDTGAATITDLLTSCIPGIHVKFYDELPKNICLQCLETLIMLNDFQKMCLKSQSEMLTLMPSTHTNISKFVSEIKLKTEDILLPETSGLEEFMSNGIDALAMNESFIKEESIEVLKQETSNCSFTEIRNERENTISGGIEGCPENGVQGYRESHGSTEVSSFAAINRQFDDAEKFTLLKVDNTSEELISSDISPSSHSLNKENQTIERVHCRETDSISSKFACKYCGREYRMRDSMVAHMRRVHQHKYYKSKAKPHECPVCPRTFKYISKLNEHKQIHTDSRQFACDECGAKFARAHDLKKHKIIHSNQMPYKCDDCDKRFYFQHNLKHHQRIHTGERAHICKYCELACNHYTALIKHLKEHLGENVYSCELCPQRFPLAKDARAHFASHKNDDKATRFKNLNALREVEAKVMENFTKDPEVMLKRESFKCKFCDERFVSRRFVDKHELTHLYPREFSNA